MSDQRIFLWPADKSPEMNARRGPAPTKFENLAGRMIRTLALVARTMRLCRRTDPALQTPMDRLREDISSLLAWEGRLDVRASHGSLYVNSRELTDPTVAGATAGVFEEFRRHGLSGFTVVRQPVTEDLWQLLEALTDDISPQLPADAMVVRPEVLLRLSRNHQDDKTAVEGARWFSSLLAASRLCGWLSRFGRYLNGEGRRPPYGVATRLLRSVARSCAAEHALLLRPGTGRGRGPEPWVAHSVNVATLAVEIGLSLGLSTERIEDLGIAALMHDVDRVRQPVEALQRGLRSPDLQRRMASSLTGRFPDRRRLSWLVLAFETRFSYRPGRIPPDALLPKAAPQNLLSRVISACDAFEATLSGAHGTQPMATAVGALAAFKERFAGSFDPYVVWKLDEAFHAAKSAA